MNKEKKIIYGLDELDQIVDQLFSLLPSCKVLAFSGPLGAGKTTLIKALLKRFGITEPITSPTFTYINVYKNKKGQTFYHFDLYRIKNLDEFFAAGFDEYLHQPDSWVFIEWPEVIEPLLQKNICFIQLDYAKGDKRQLTF